ncbi:large ribosomal subunit protein uL4c-like [Rutidosis leptorrhynchoides]|uniref:large ribosomal subunit protein uL4c-like n=1 Tax=Rutidosis leptorrhynchoides TaxID=125765 RepID=UPI003A99EEB0
MASFLKSSFLSSTIFSNHSPSVFIKPPNPTRFPKSTTTVIRSELATLPILSFDGTKIDETSLNLKSAHPDTARAVVHRGITTDLNNKRRGTASTLTRAKVRGGGKKPFPQKKLDRARHGSQLTLLRPGGGVVFEPKPRDWSVKINKKEKRLVISTALASTVVNRIVVEEFGEKFEKPKTKEFIEVLKRWGIDPKEKSMFFITLFMLNVDDNVALSSRNTETLRMLTPRTLNLFNVLNADKLVFTQGLDYLNDVHGDDDVDVFEDEDEDEEAKLGFFSPGAKKNLNRSNFFGQNLKILGQKLEILGQNLKILRQQLKNLGQNLKVLRQNL